MSNSWWKRLFNLEDDDWEEEDNGFLKEDINSYRAPIGRLEDADRHIQVRMVKQYPKGVERDVYTPTFEKVRKSQAHISSINNEKSKSSGHEEKPKQGHHDGGYTPAYQKAGRRRHEKSAPEKVKEPLLPKKKTPFRRTEVPSPVYGFRPRPMKVRETPEIKHPEEQRVVGNKPLPTQPQPAKEVQKSEERKPTVQEVEREVVQVEALPSEVVQVEALPSIEEPVNALISDKKPEVETENAIEQENNINTERIDQPSPVEEKKVQITRPRSPKVPYNVLMFRSDKQQLQTPKEKVRESAEKPNKPMDNNQSGTVDPLSMDLLNTPKTDLFEDATWLDEQQEILQQTLQNFQVKAEMMGFVEGPTVTRFDIKLHPGVKINKVINLTEDIKLSLAAKQIRIAPVPGNNTVGIEVPNDHRKAVSLRNVLESAAFKEHTSPLAAVLGQDVTGENIVTDLSKMPHGLIAGATGSGKSVCIHSLILSLIYKSNPDKLRLILIDPKVVELAAYQNLPHLAAPVITQPKEASLALKWAVDEMERRYHVFANERVRDITRYNDSVEKQGLSDQTMPYIVIIIDELADLMMVSPQDVEEAICRIAQKARAAGIHLILATQRPSVDVITGLIKSNIPTRIAFSVSSMADSRTILDSGGAERLLGQGDMLFSENGVRDVKRLQGCYVSDEEIDRITDVLAQKEAPPFLFDKEEISAERHEALEEEDDLFEEAGCFVINQGQASVSSLQRRFRIGYNRAARLIDQLESLQVISESNGSKPRQILMSVEAFKGNIVSQEMY